MRHLPRLDRSKYMYTFKHFEVPTSHLKKSECLELAKKNASLVFLQSLAFTILYPGLQLGG